MNWLVLMAVLAGSDPEAARTITTGPAIPAAVSPAEPDVRTGTLIFSQGDCAAVRIYTGSPFTHVGVVVLRNGLPFVYDSAKTSGARCQTLDNYFQSQALKELHVFQPVREFSPAETRRLETWLDQQLGRPYAIAHHLTGERVAGVHCSEYVSEALRHAGRLSVNQPARVSPASLLEGITRHALYRPGLVMQTGFATPAPPASAGWCATMWQETCDCTVWCWKKTTGTLLCW